MYKKIIVLAVTSVLTTPLVAKTNVNVYGQLQVELAQQDVSGDIDTVVDDNKRGRIGFKAVEDLADGMKAIVHFEWQVDTSNANPNDGRRVSLVGLQGNYGRLVVGSLNSPYKYTGGVKYDPFVTTFLQARSNGGMSGQIESAIAANATGTNDAKGAFGHHGFIHNAVGYSIKHNSLSLNGVYSPDDQGDKLGSRGDYAMALKYKSSKVEAFLASSNDDSSELNAKKMGGKLKMENSALMIQYEMIDAAGTNVDVMFLGCHYMIEKNMLVAQIGNTRFDQPGTDDINYYTLGVIHKFSKKARVFTGYRDTDDDSAIKNSVISLGLRVDFSS